MLFYEFDHVFEIGYSCCFGAVVGAGDEVVDCDFVIVKEGMDVCLVEDASALGLWKDEVEEEAQSDPGVEWNPNENEAGPGLKEQCAGQYNPVHQPWL